jgi:hypothetical protein
MMPDIRTILYKSAQFIGDYRAVRRGQILPRIGRRIIGRLAGKLLGRFKL